ACAARDDPRRRVLRNAAPLDDAHQGAHADLRASWLAPWSRRERQERAAGEAFLFGDLQIDRRDPARGAVRERELRRGFRKALRLGLSFGVDQRAEPREVLGEIHAGRRIITACRARRSTGPDTSRRPGGARRAVSTSALP